MKGDLEAALKRWRAAGPLSTESMRFLVNCRELNLLKQPTECKRSANDVLFDLTGL